MVPWRGKDRYVTAEKCFLQISVDIPMRFLVVPIHCITGQDDEIRVDVLIEVGDEADEFLFLVYEIRVFSDMKVGELNNRVLGWLCVLYFYRVRPGVILFCCCHGNIVEPIRDAVDIIRNNQFIFEDVRPCFDPGAPCRCLILEVVMSGIINGL